MLCFLVAFALHVLWCAWRSNWAASVQDRSFVAFSAPHPAGVLGRVLHCAAFSCRPVPADSSEEDKWVGDVSRCTLLQLTGCRCACRHSMMAQCGQVLQHDCCAWLGMRTLGGLAICLDCSSASAMLWRSCRQQAHQRGSTLCGVHPHEVGQVFVECTHMNSDWLRQHALPAFFGSLILIPHSQLLSITLGSRSRSQGRMVLGRLCETCPLSRVFAGVFRFAGVF